MTLNTVNYTEPATGKPVTFDDCAAAGQVQVVKIDVGALGTVTPASTTNRVPVDARLPAAAALANGMGTPTAPAVAAHGMQWNGATWDMAVANQSVPNLLSSAARTASTDTPAQTNRGHRKIQLVLSVSAITAGASVTVQFVGTSSGATYFLTPAPTAVTATGTYVYELGEGCSGAVSGATTPNVVQRTAGAIPRGWYAAVTHLNATSITYALHAELMN